MEEYWRIRAKENAVWRLVEKQGREAAAKMLGVDVDSVDEEMLRLRYEWDFPAFASDRLKIRNKDGLIVPFNLNKPQLKMDSIIQRARISRRPVRLCLLKARQWGGSTEGEGICYKDTILRSGRSSLIVAHDLDSARGLREMSKRFYDYYMFEKPEMKKESDKWWKFLHQDGGVEVSSDIRIDTADELTGGHSLTLHNLHLSEVQLWRNAAELVKGLFPTVPNSPDTFIFMEGTGSGVGNYWYDFCQMAQSKDQNEWDFLFIPWFEIEDYRREFDSGSAKAQFEKDLDLDAKDLFEKGVTLEQLQWRYITINQTLKGDLDAFHQQYPASPEEAFVSSGRPVFHIPTVKRQIERAETPVYYELVYREGKVQLVENPHGLWRVWETTPAQGDHLYCIGVDPAEGMDVIPELGNRGADYSAARVFRRDKRRFVATLQTRIDTDLVEEEVWKACLFWGAAVLPEQNGQAGGSFIRGIKDRPGINLVRTPELGRQREGRKDEFGWETNKQTRRMLIDEMREQIRERDYEDPDREAWLECFTFIFDAKGKPIAQSRKFDDLVLATAITLQADILIAEYAPMRVARPKPPLTRDLDVPENWANDGEKAGTLTRRTVMEETYHE